MLAGILHVQITISHFSMPTYTGTIFFLGELKHARELTTYSLRELKHGGEISKPHYLFVRRTKALSIRYRRSKARQSAH